jgi:hypothetical protein
MNTLFLRCLTALILAAPWLDAAVNMGTPSALPSALAVNTPARVTITIPIPDSTLIAGGVNLLRVGAVGQSPTVLGQFHDDGLNGDAVAGDNIYSLQITLNETAPTTVRLQVSAAFRGLLQRVLSPVFNVVVTTTGTLPLPPDPGPGGMLTLAGIDSDGDGVRDDVQRFIALTYPSSQKMQTSLTQLAKTFFAGIVDSGNAQLSVVDSTESLYSVDCLFYISPSNANQLLNQLLGQILNTSERVAAYLASSSSQGFRSYTLPSSLQQNGRCMINPDTLPN